MTAIGVLYLVALAYSLGCMIAKRPDPASGAHFTAAFVALLLAGAVLAVSVIA